MPLRVAEVSGWLKAVNECNQCPYGDRLAQGLCCGHLEIRQTPHEFSPVQLGFIPVWCPLPREELNNGKITTVGDRIKPLPNEHSESSLDREYR